MMQADIGIIGGSGFYDFLDGQEVVVETPFGEPSDKILLFDYAGKKIAFLPRHGKKHHLPPHQINYKANLFALKKIGVKQIIAPSAVGSLKPEIAPGHFVLADQFLNFTRQRQDTFFNGPKVAHISTAEPYCPELRGIAQNVCSGLGVPFHKQGTVLVIEGPRFSSKAESLYFSNLADVVNMTQYPEVVLARELEMCYLNISLATDYDVGIKDRSDIKAVSAEDVFRVFKQNNEKLKEIILAIIKDLPVASSSNCACSSALKNAFL